MDGVDEPRPYSDERETVKDPPGAARAEPSAEPSSADPLKERFDAERPRGSVERKQALADLESTLFGRPRRVVTVSRYVLLKRIAAGGGGVVYSAFDPELDRKVAIKLIRTTGQEEADREQAAARLTREARAAAKLSHPNVVTVHDVGTYDPAEIGLMAGTSPEAFGSEFEREIEKELPATGVFVVMEFIAGKNLAEWVEEREPTWQQILEVYLQAGDGLAAAHASGLVHRDFKPSNVMIGRDGRVRVLDFGLARQHDEAEPPPAEGIPQAALDRTIDPSRPLTHDGAVLGTPAYMPPEQHAGETADARSDQWSYCAALYESLQGRLPFEGEDIDALAEAKRTDKPAVPDEDKVPAWIADVLRRGLRLDPAQRYPSMREMLDELGHNPAESRIRFLIGTALLGTIAVLLGVLVLGPDAEPVCPDPAQPLAGIWDDDRKAEIGAAFSASDKPYAESVWSSTESTIDDYVDRWVTARGEACQKTLVRQEQSPELMGAQMLCLDSRLNRLAELTRLLATGEPQVIETALDGVAMLSPLESCTDPKLASRTLLPPVGVRDEVMAVDAEIARAEALRRAGKLDDATQAIDEALEHAKPLKHPPLEARALLLRGQIRSVAKDGNGAEAALRQALLIAEATGDDDTAVRTLVELGFVEGFLHKRHDDGERTLELARAKLSRHNPGPHVQGLLERNTGILLLDQRRYDDAFKPLDRARILLADAYGEKSTQVTAALNALGLLAVSKGDFAVGIDYYSRSLEILKHNLGEKHPTVAGLMGNLGVIALEQGDWAKAEEYQREGLAVLREAVGDDHPFVAQALSNLAASLVGAGRIDDSIELQREALRIKRARLDPGDPSIAVSLNNLGAALNLAGQDEEALELHEQALKLRSDALGPEHPETHLSHTNIGLSQLALGDHAAARTTLTKAIAGLEKEYGADSVKLVEALRGLAEAELARGNTDEATKLIARATRLIDTKVVDPVQIADVHFVHAQLTFEFDPEGARKLAEGAAEAYATLGDENPRAKRIAAWLAEH